MVMTMDARRVRAAAGQDGAAVSTELPVGMFTYRAGDDSVQWSAELCELFGFAPGDVVATLALLATHQHPNDRAGWDDALQQVLQGRQPVALWHRILNATRKAHTLHTLLTSTRDDSGVPTIYGVVTDLTRRLQQDRAEEATRAVVEATRTRTTIDQAKEILMGVFNVDDEQAFDLLRWHSSRSNVKLRDIAAAIVERLPDPAAAMESPRQRLTALLADLGGTRRGQQPVAAAPVHAVTPTASDTASQAVTTERIPTGVLPQTMVLAAAHSITIADCTAPDEPLVYVNPAFEASTGYTSAEVLGRNCRLLQGPDTDPEQVAAIGRAIRAGDTVRTVLLNYRKDGTPFWNELLLAPVKDDTGRSTHYVGYQSDVSERVERELQLERLAYHHAPTGLPNQAAALRHLDTAIATHPDSPHTVIHLQLDGAHRDSTTEPADIPTVLAAAAQALRRSLPDLAFLATADGNAFLIVSSGTDTDEASRLSAETARQLHQLIANSSATAVSIRHGHAVYPADTTDPSTLINLAALGPRHQPPGTEPTPRHHRLTPQRQMQCAACTGSSYL